MKVLMQKDNSTSKRIKLFVTKKCAMHNLALKTTTRMGYMYYVGYIRTATSSNERREVEVHIKRLHKRLQIVY